MRGTAVRSIEISEAGVICTFGGGVPSFRMLCPPDDQRSPAIEALNLRMYEAVELAALLRIFRGGVFIDIGANIGYYSLAVASRYPSASVYAFEPIPATFDFLERNISLNGLANIAAHNLGLSNKAGELTFLHDPAISGATSSSALLPAHSTPQQITCRVDTLDAFVGERNLQVTFIKCDVEGAELHIFRGAAATLAEQKPIVLAEMLRKWSARFGYHPNEMISFFAKLGYCCYAASENGLRRIKEVTELTVETNYFFVHSCSEEIVAPLLQSQLT